MRLREIKVVSEYQEVGLMWYGPPCKGGGELHCARRKVLEGPVGTLPESLDWQAHGMENWPWGQKCDNCDAVGPTQDQYDRTLWPEGKHPTRFSGKMHTYDTASGQPEPGDVFEMPWYHHDDKCFEGWENCDGYHCTVVLPNGSHWHVQSRACNCTLPNDNIHRCWVVHGRGASMHVDKGGHTCAAGAGSVLVTGWHGFLVHGELRSC